MIPARRKTTLAAVVAATLLLVALVSRPAPAKIKLRTVERIVAIINSQIVLLSQLQERISPMMPRLRQIPDIAARKQKLAELQRQALDQMINEKLIAQQARKLKLKVSKRALERAVQDVMRRNNLTLDQLKEALKREGKTLQGYKNKLLRPQLLRLRVLNVTVRSRVSVTDDEIKARYQQNLRQLGVDAKVHARHIFIDLPRPRDAADVKKRTRRANELLARLKKGAKFALLAKKHSEDPVTRTQGGDLGWFGRGTLPTAIEDVVFNMKKGEIRGPLRSERGLHIMQVVAHRKSSARPLKDVRTQLKRQIYGQKLQKATDAWLREVRKKAHVVIKL